MMIKRMHEAVEDALNAISTKGGESLYNRYISQKIPNHANQSSNNYLYTTVHGAYNDPPDNKNMKRDLIPKNIMIDRIAPSKVQKRPKSHLGYHNTEKIKLQSSIIMNKTSNKINEIQEKQQQKQNLLDLKRTPKKTRNEIQISAKPKFSIKYECKKYEGASFKQEQEQSNLRNKKAQSIKQKQQQSAKEASNNKQKNWKRQRLERRIQEMTNLGIRYAFDDDGQIIGPNEKQIKQIAKKSQNYSNKVDSNEKKVKDKKVLGMKYKTLDAKLLRAYPQEAKTIVGKKKGFISSKFYKKQRLTDRQYNNQNYRQYTTIPFLNLTSGITFIEKERNVTASKSKQPAQNRQQFLKESRVCSFKSYLPENEDRFALSLQTLSIERPFTTAHEDRQFRSAREERTKRTAETNNTSRKKSILWRPQTTNQSCRMSVNNVELVRQFVRQ